jgi:glycosyltransferase involved in cell wall biosynthesis
MDKPLISFVLPSYNRIAWIGEAVQSCLAQTEKNIEVVIVDDGSTDGTFEMLQEWLGENPKVKLIRNEKNLGAGPSRHKGAEAARGEIILVCDSDDMNVNERAELALKWFKENPESELVNFPYVSVSYVNEILESFEGEKFNEDEYKKSGYINYYCNPSVAVKKKSYFETKGYEKENDKETDDRQFVRNWVNAGKKIDFAPGDPIVLHRVLPDSMCVKFRGFDPKWATKN